MEGWIKFETTRPEILVEVEVMYAGRIIKSRWGVISIEGETVWALDLSGQVMPMWWRPIIAE